MGILLIFIFLIWPLGAVLLSLANYNRTWTKNIIWLFVVFYGYTFVLSNDTMDANRIKSKFEFFHYSNFGFTDVVNYFFLYNEDGVDIIQPVILYLTSLFSYDFQVLMAVLASILGYFYSRNISYLMSKSRPQIHPYNYLILWMFVFTVGFWEINMFRFWTAALMMFYAVIPFVYENTKSRLWLLPLVPLIHFSFLYPLLVLLVFVLLKDQPKLYFYTFLASFFIFSIDTENIGDILMGFLPSNFEYKVRAYTSAEYAEEVRAYKTSISGHLRKTMFIILNSTFVILYYWYKHKFKRNLGMSRLFAFALLIMTAGNFANLFPTGDRFLIFSALFSLTFLFLFIQHYGMRGSLKHFLYFSAPFLFFASFGFLRLGFNTINIAAIIGNPAVLFFVESNKALIDFF